MIYDHIAAVEALEQGDIFSRLPKVELELDDLILPEVSDSGLVQFRKVPWIELQSSDVATRAVVAVRRVTGILITQTCDAARAEALSFCEVGSFYDVVPGIDPATKIAKLVKALTKEGKDDQRWYYLPPDPNFGFIDRMAVDFRSVFSISKPATEGSSTIDAAGSDLDRFRTLRIGRLKHVAREHFREKLAQFFRRYPYDPWYPLSQTEFEEYSRDHPGEQPFDWQR
jgi:hypothetical protein